MASVSTSFTTFGTEARAGSFGGAESWGTPSNAQADDGSRAIFDVNLGVPWPDGYTFYLTAKDMTDDVPNDAEIDGIEIRIQRRVNINATSTWNDSVVYIIQDGTISTTENKAVGTAYTNSDVEVTYGGPTDKWGLTWVSDDVQAVGFGLAISCATSGQEMESSNTCEIDLIEVTVYYTVAAGGGGVTNERVRVQAA